MKLTNAEVNLILDALAEFDDDREEEIGALAERLRTEEEEDAGE